MDGHTNLQFLMSKAKDVQNVTLAAGTLACLRRSGGPKKKMMVAAS